MVSIFRFAFSVSNSERYMYMLTKVISCFATKHCWCLKLISWKHSFNRLNEEYELAKKKKQALDNLLEKGRISQSTYDSFNSEIAVAIAEIEKQQQALISKMQLKTDELENQIKTLEMLLANYEIQHVAGEIDEETYKLEIELLSNGLAKTKHELESIKEATNQLCTPKSFEVTPTVAASPQVEVAPSSPQITCEAEVVPAANIEVPSSPEPIVDAPIPTPEQASAPAIEEAPVAESTVVEGAAEPVAETIDVAPSEVPQETAQTVEETVVEQAEVEVPVEQVKVEVAEPTIEEIAPIADEVIADQPTIDETEVAEEVIEAETPAVVEEIATENPCQAPEVAPTEEIAAAPEVCEETPPASISTVKEPTSPVETSDSDENKKE
jgi:hypothetical protein